MSPVRLSELRLKCIVRSVPGSSSRRINNVYAASSLCVPFVRQLPLAISYKGVNVDCAYRLDFLIQEVVVEIKSVAAIDPIHEAQLLTYMKLGRWKLGLLINFNVKVLTRGIRRLIL
jgi:GxxExxY protein